MSHVARRPSLKLPEPRLRYDPVAFSIRPRQRVAGGPARPRVQKRVDLGSVALLFIASAATGLLGLAMMFAVDAPEPEAAPLVSPPVANAAAFDLAPLRKTS